MVYTIDVLSVCVSVSIAYEYQYTSLYDNDYLLRVKYSIWPIGYALLSNVIHLLCSPAQVQDGSTGLFMTSASALDFVAKSYVRQRHVVVKGLPCMVMDMPYPFAWIFILHTQGYVLFYVHNIHLLRHRQNE